MREFTTGKFQTPSNFAACVGVEGESRTALQRTGTTVSCAGDTQGANQAHLQHHTLSTP